MRALDASLREAAARVLTQRWGSTRIVSRGVCHQADRLPGLAVCDARGRVMGLVTWQVRERSLEVVSLDSLEPGRGLGSALLAGAEQAAREQSCVRVWLVTTNDNLPALGFYQRRGYRLSALRRDALEASRALKPGIPTIGRGGIPLRDELELEKLLDG